MSGTNIPAPILAIQPKGERIGDHHPIGYDDDIQGALAAMAVILATRPRPKLVGDECYCAECLKVFRTTVAFDRHRAGSLATKHCR